MKISVSILILTILGLVVGSPSHAEEREVLDFELKDQFENVHRSSDVAGNIVLLIGSDRGGSQFNDTWGKAIHVSLSDHPRYDQISHLAYADLRGVPFFVKGVVRGKFPQNPMTSLPNPPTCWYSHRMAPSCTTHLGGSLTRRPSAKLSTR